MMHVRLPLRLALMATATGVALAGCGTGSAPTSTQSVSGPDSIDGVGPVSRNAAVAAAVPAEAAKAGVLRVGTNAPYEPFIAFAQEGTTDKFKGLDYDLITAVAATMGLKAEFQQQPFDGLIPGMQAGKYDAIAGGITDNKARESSATFVDYSASGTGILVLKDNPSGIQNLATLCGKAVAVQKAAKQVDLLKAFSQTDCAQNPITITEYPQNPDAFNALLAGKADAFVATKVNLAAIADTAQGKASVLDDAAAPNGYKASPTGVGFTKTDSALAGAFKAGLQSLMDDGTYAKLLTKWKQTSMSIPSATSNAAVD